ncbi:MAG: DEAD/DEAH box helicase [Candidatus Magasanikbacteria bacterium]|nr:DEAD/DEAH box helicase [Candidatus Magasanikbacteria bacterium]
MKTLRPYQEEAKSAILEAVSSGFKTVLISMASGLGKTVLAGNIIRYWLENYGGKVLFILHMTDPLYQAKQEFEEALFSLEDKPGISIVNGVVKEDKDATVLLSTFQTMQESLVWELEEDEFSLVIVDEAHHSHAETYKEIIDYFTPRFMLGMTATPFRGDGLDIRDIFGDEVYSYGLKEALADNEWLAEVEYRLLTDNISREVIQDLIERVRQEDRSISKTKLDKNLFLVEKLEAIAETVKAEQSVADKQAVIFCRSISHLRRVNKYFPEAVSYHSGLKTKTLKERFQAFQRGEIRTLLTVDMFNEAIDIPTVDLIVFLRSTRSAVVWYQQLGRGLRKTRDKQKVVVMDFVGTYRRLEFIGQLVSVGLRDDYDTDVREVSTGFKVFYDEYLEEVVGILDYVDVMLSRNFYPTWEEASKAAQALGFKTVTEYKEHYRKDLRLPSYPNKSYSEVWKEKGGWPGFLGKKIISFYETWEEASKAAQALGFKTKTEYQEHYRKDLRLPSDPNNSYSEVWKEKGRLAWFLG